VIRSGELYRANGGLPAPHTTHMAHLGLPPTLGGRGSAPGAIVCGGQTMSFNDIISAIEAGSGRRIRRIPMSTKMFRAIGWV